MPSHCIVLARLYISCIHACHAYCIVFGIGISPGTGNEVRFVLRVTERVSIPRRRHSRFPMMEFRSCCVFMCIHFILSRAIQLLGHHASICVIGGTRIEDYTPWRVVKHTYVKNTLPCPFLALCCSKLKISSFQKPCAAFRRQVHTEANWGIAVDFRAKQPEYASFILWSGVKAVPSLHASLQLS